jgi:2,4-dienoyl-CoA reductase-like NADH-dependent reductase (Old Yellow Enzyme family)
MESVYRTVFHHHGEIHPTMPSLFDPINFGSIESANRIEKGFQEVSPPRALRLDEIPRIVGEYASGAEA